jgi:hypothetical protein
MPTFVTWCYEIFAIEFFVLNREREEMEENKTVLCDRQFHEDKEMLKLSN